METLQERCKRIWEGLNVSPDDIQWGIAMLTSEAKEHSELILDEQIERAALFLKLFGGLPKAIGNYLAWERKQI